MAKKLAAFRIDREVLDALAAIKHRDGPDLTWQVDRALRDWIKKKRIGLPTGTTRKPRR